MPKKSRLEIQVDFDDKERWLAYAKKNHRGSLSAAMRAAMNNQILNKRDCPSIEDLNEKMNQVLHEIRNVISGFKVDVGPSEISLDAEIQAAHKMFGPPKPNYVDEATEAKEKWKDVDF